MFFGFYLQRINYAFMVVGITVTVSQLYVQLGEFTNSLLLTRLAETALGATIAIGTVSFVLPLRTRNVLRTAMRAHLAAMAGLVGHATEQLLDRDAAVMLRSDARALDAAHQSLLATAGPLRRNLLGDPDETVAQVVGLAGAYRNYGRNLATDVDTAPGLDGAGRRDLERASQTINESIGVVLGAIDGPRDGTYTRSASLFERVELDLEADEGGVGDSQLAIRDLKLIDEALASLAAAMTLRVANYDTAIVGGAR